MGLPRLLRSAAVLGVLLGAASSARAQEVPPAAPAPAAPTPAAPTPAAPVLAVSTPAVVAPEASDRAEDGTSVEPSQKNIVGTQRYFSNDTSVLLNLPGGYSFNTTYSFYSSNTSSRTTTLYLGAGKLWDEGTLKFTYSTTPRANNFRAHSYELVGAYFTPSKNFRTTFGGTFNWTYNTQFIPPRSPIKPSRIVEIRQIGGTLNLKQKIYDTKLTLDVGKSTYDQEISRLSDKINPNSTRLQGLAGLLQGFPDMEWKFGLYRTLQSLPLTLWASYDHIRLLVATQASHGNSDSYMAGADWDPTDWFTSTLQYNYLTQTGQPASSYYGLMLGLRL